MVEWTEGRMDGWINRQIEKQTGLVASLHLKDLHWPFQRVTRILTGAEMANLKLLN